MKGVFADTSFYVAVINDHDALHEMAGRVARDYRGGIVTTEYVLVELGNWLARSIYKERFGIVAERILSDPMTTVVASARPLLTDGIRLYVGRPDKEWSLTDCISFVVMGQLGLTDALTADHHFRQAGFTPLLV